MSEVFEIVEKAVISFASTILYYSFYTCKDVMDSVLNPGHRYFFGIFLHFLFINEIKGYNRTLLFTCCPFPLQIIQ